LWLNTTLYPLSVTHISEALIIRSPQDERRLVENYLRRRDEQSFRELYRRHTPRLYALALRLCDSSADANDAVQDMWIRACTGLARFAWKSSLKTWLTGILINCVREQSRKHREEQLPDDWTESIVTPNGAQLNLEQAIARLPGGYRDVLLLHDLEGYTHEEIGAVLDINAGTSKSQLHYARKAIRKLME
jgi:RNA polymerase sigma-70 factor (ECF subfamily)